MNDLFTQIRLQAENDLEAFITLVHPQTVLGNIHREVIRWWNKEESKTHQLVLLPRDHGKSRLVAYRAAWEITRNPTVRILYISSTQNLATKQLKFIKDILTSDIYRRYWPEMVNAEEATREKWTEGEISVDHPRRKAEAVRDPTVFTAGLTTNVVGLHCDIAILDDVVTGQNAYTEEGREKVDLQYQLLASIEGADAQEWVVGTRYHPKDLYDSMLNKEYEIYDEDGDIIETVPLYESLERVVEIHGVFLWPRQQRYDGKWFGFDQNILAKKRSQYDDGTQFRAQYYNDPNDVANAPIGRELFQYFKPEFLSRFDGKWSYKGRRLNVFAAVDFAFSLDRKADFTSIVVVGVDFEGNIYVLDIDRFKTDKISEYFRHILHLHQKWDFRKIRAEVTAAQAIIVKDLKDNYIRNHGLALAVEEAKPNRHEGNKEERINAALQPKYANLQMWHNMSDGNTQTLEEELVLQRPPHDDVKDCLASVMSICQAPTTGTSSYSMNKSRQAVGNLTHTRFGGLL
jgi:hypothetical protein